MANIYQYGSKTIQTMPNYVYKSFEELKKNNDEIRKCSENKGEKNRNKITGAAVAEIFRKNIEYVLKKNGLTNMYKVSENNVYVKGCYNEFDLLILKKTALKVTNNYIMDNGIIIELPIYDSSDVIAVLESKTYGIYSLYKGRTNDKINEMEKNELYGFVSAYKDELNGMEKGIKIGYMCLAEQRPNAGESNFLEKTIYFFEDYFGQKYNETDKVWHTYFSKCHFANKTQDVYATDDMWEEFVLSLVR